MEILKSVSINLIIFQLMFLPVANAKPFEKKIKRVPASQSVASSEITERLETLFGLENNQGWEFRDAKNEGTTLTDLMSSGTTEFHLLSPVDKDGKQYGAKLKLIRPDDKANMSIAIAIYDKDFKKALSRRAMKLDTSKPASESLVRMEQTINAMEQELGIKASKKSSFFNFGLMSNAYAGESSALRRLLKIAFWGGVGIFALPFLLGLSVEFKSKKAAKIFLGIWFGALAVAGLTLTIDYVANEKFPWE